MTLFGAWLVQRGRVTAAQILTALEVQERQRPAIHEVAMSMRRLTPTQVLQIVDEQRKSGLSFEKQAASSGVLDAADIDAIRGEQMRYGPKLGEVLVQLGHLSVVQLQRDLGDFLEADAMPRMAHGRTPAAGVPRRL